ncbi:cAMP dependent protein kinase A catalytic subunit [Podospora appendiculata]|uniref:cAMP-dependent protein kinase n=1 Tax=Podospora appendiculata TaxID=314037 RepID=A0AAE1CFZ0_9PEZI|nr:cAMP dependent protein kinase A catalytic subunit [Podospora appendiculata]
MPSLGFLKKKRTREGNTDPSPPSNPTSPVTPTAARNFDQSTLPLAPAHSASSQTTSHSVTASKTDISQPQPQPQAAAAEKQSMNTLQQPYQQQPPPQPTPSPGSEPQNLPSISNLINPPQNEGLTAYQAQIGSRYQPPPASGSPAQNPPSQPATMSAPQQQQQQPQQQQQAPQDQARVTKGKYSLADFEILRTLGTGSFGRVHLVQSRHNSRYYAVKVLKKAQVVKMKQVEHTNDERKMLGEVKHPFLITLWGTFQDSRNLYMVMDFVEGGELFSLLRKSGRFPNPVAKFYAAEVTLALEYLHSKNIIYRDLKPENLLLDRHGHLKITDFGFAKRVPDKTWTLCGTPDYLAPEVVSNKGYNKSVDWWSLGILIYEMLCGYTPFWDGGSPMKIYENILRGKIKYPAYINPDAQNLLERLITADLTKRLGNLYAGPSDVKNHPWFSEVTWDRLARKDIDAPYTPPVKAGQGDASQFDRYPEETERYGQAGNDEYAELFVDF